MKTFIGMLIAALGAAALLVACGACGGDTGASEALQLSAEAAVEDDCVVCLLFDLDAEGDDD